MQFAWNSIKLFISGPIFTEVFLSEQFRIKYTQCCPKVCVCVIAIKMISKHPFWSKTKSEPETWEKESKLKWINERNERCRKYFPAKRATVAGKSCCTFAASFGLFICVCICIYFYFTFWLYSSSDLWLLLLRFLARCTLFANGDGRVISLKNINIKCSGNQNFVSPFSPAFYFDCSLAGWFISVSM